MPEMTPQQEISPQQALAVLDNYTARIVTIMGPKDEPVPLMRSDHGVIVQAINVLGALINPAPVTEAPEEQPESNGEGEVAVLVDSNGAAKPKRAKAGPQPS